MARWEMNVKVSASEGSNPMKPRPDDDVPALRYGSMSLEEIQEGVSAEAVGYAAGLLVEALRHYESSAFSAREQKPTSSGVAERQRLDPNSPSWWRRRPNPQAALSWNHPPCKSKDSGRRLHSCGLRCDVHRGKRARSWE